MMKADAPMTGGRNCPPQEATASTAAAKYPLKPRRFISGIVKTPVEATLAADDPWIMPIMPLARMPTLAGPPGLWPAAAKARLVKKVVVPDFCRKAPKRMKR